MKENEVNIKEQIQLKQQSVRPIYQLERLKCVRSSEIDEICCFFDTHYLVHYPFRDRNNERVSS